MTDFNNSKVNNRTFFGLLSVLSAAYAMKDNLWQIFLHLGSFTKLNMGLIQSVFCSMIFCVERVLTWTCCAFVLMLLMFGILVLMIYGISVGYHYAQKELSSFALSSRSTTEPTILRRSGQEGQPVVRLVAVNRSEVEHAPGPILEIYQTKKPGEQVFLETSETPVIVLETERPPRHPDLSPQERDLARRLIGRFRRSKNATSTVIPFLRPLNTTEPPILITAE